MIIAHGDVDGVISAVIAARSLGEDAEFYFSGPRSIDRALSILPGGGDKLLIVDIAVNPDKVKDVEDQLRRLSESGWRITWIDHHAWPSEAIERFSKYADMRIRRALSAARVVLEELGGDEYEEELVAIADDADTATYADERAKMYNALTRDKGKREYLLKALLNGRLVDEKVKEWAMEKIREQERAVEDGIRHSRIEETRGGRKFAVIDLRPKGGPGSLISKRLAEEWGVEFSLVIYSCSKFSLYAGKDKGANLKPICEAHGGGGHPYACGGKIEIDLLGRLICLLLGRRYKPKQIKELIEEVKSKL